MAHFRLSLLVDGDIKISPDQEEAHEQIWGIMAPWQEEYGEKPYPVGEKWDWYGVEKVHGIVERLDWADVEITFAVLTPGGQWYQNGSGAEWFGDISAHEAWCRLCVDLIKAYAECRLIRVNCHC